MTRVRGVPRHVLLDAALALAVGLAAAAGMWQTSSWQAPPVRSADLLGYALVVLGAGALVLRRHLPLPVLALTTATATAALLLHYPYGPPFLAAGLAMYFVAAGAPWRRAVFLCVTACAALVGAVLVAVDASVTRSPVMVGGALGWMTLPCSIGVVLRARREDLTQSREEEVRRGAYAERLRIAREIHETAGQGLAAINVQSAAALRLADEHPGRALEILRAINRTSKQALQDLRTTLGTLEQATPREAPRQPLPGLSRLGSLVSTMSSSGLDVQVVESGERGELSVAVDLAAFRIVQQSLANVLRHASSTTATVRVEHGGTAVLLEITDNRDAEACRRSANQETTGITEQVAAVGGHLRAGPRAGGGYQVLVRLPRR